MFENGTYTELQKYAAIFAETGQVGLNELSDHPTEVIFPDQIHDIFEDMRTVSFDGNERLIYWGIPTTGTLQILTPEPLVGHANGFSKDKINAGEDGSLGRILAPIHTHPGIPALDTHVTEIGIERMKKDLAGMKPTQAEDIRLQLAAIEA